jgi:hypothetical protein
LAYKEFTQNGGTVVTVAGNERSDLSEHQFYPGSYAYDFGFTKYQKKMKTKDGKPVYTTLKSLYVVQNEARDTTMAPTSNTYPFAYKELGVDILSTLPNGQYGYMTGTSQAAPAFLHIILKQKCKELNR